MLLLTTRIDFIQWEDLSMTIQRFFVAGILFFAFTASPLRSETWPAWRGMAGRAVSAETNLPTEWSADKNLAWVTDLPGRMLELLRERSA